MSGAKFTRGEWVKCADTVGIRCNDDTQDYGMVKAVAYLETFDFKEQWEANAHLIAAAPEMYEMLVGMIPLCQTSVQYNAIEDLLAKARGEK